jgi:sugar O-acyltransferase (sialic acid O-acetyltransferase NeuD family)
VGAVAGWHDFATFAAMENPVIIFGANALGRVAKEIFESNGVVVYGFLDDDAKKHKSEIDEVVVLGSMDDDGFLKLIGKKCEAFVAVDDMKLRRGLVEMLNEVRHLQPVNAIHATAAVSARASIGHGNLIDAHVLIEVGAEVGNHCLLHNRVAVGAECKIGSFVQIGAGSNINSNVIIEDDVFIGSGVTIVSGVTVGKGARVGAGSVVIGPIKSKETVFGNPAQAVKS